jgi:hypothetical protein
MGRDRLQRWTWIDESWLSLGQHGYKAQTTWSALDLTRTDQSNGTCRKGQKKVCVFQLLFNPIRDPSLGCENLGH